MLQDLVEEILNEVLGEDEKKDKEAVKEAVREAVEEIYGEEEFTETEIYNTVDEYFNKLENSGGKSEENKVTSGNKNGTGIKIVMSELEEELDDIISDEEIENILTPDTYEEENWESEDINFDLDDEIDFIELSDKTSEKTETAEEETETEEKTEEETEIETNQDGRSFYQYISLLREHMLSLWEEDREDMKEQFNKNKTILKEIIKTIKTDESEHKQIASQIQDKEIKSLNQDFLKMLNLFQNSVEEIIKFMDTEDPTYSFSSKKNAVSGNELMISIGEKLKGLM